MRQRLPARSGLWRYLIGLSLAFLCGATVSGSARQTANAQGNLDVLSLVYLDSFRGDAAEVWVAGPDGSEPRMVASFPPGTSARALGGRYVALTDGDAVLALDLVTAETRRFDTGGLPVRSVFIDPSGTLFYATRGGCPGPEPQPDAVIVRIDLGNGAETELSRSRAPGVDVLHYDAGADELTVLPRACDVGLSAIRVLDASTGAEKSSTPIEGCGSASVSPDRSTAISLWRFCTLPESHRGANATVYDLTTGAWHDLSTLESASTTTPFLFSPDSRRAAYAVQVTGPGTRPVSGGVYVLDLATGAAREMDFMQEDRGAEQFPLSWSPDGTSLLVGSVLAMGFCSFNTLDTVARTVTPLPEEIRFCGVSGQVLGWTTLR